MIAHEPLWDLDGRTLSLGFDVSLTVEALLRLQNAADYQRPISLYLIGSPSAATLSPTDALMLCGLIRTLRSPVQTIAMGILQQAQPLLLAAGTHRRVLLPHSLIALGPLRWQATPSTLDPIGLNHVGQRNAAQAVLAGQVEQLMKHLKLDPKLFTVERLLDANGAIACGLADEVITKTLSQATPPKEKICEVAP